MGQAEAGRLEGSGRGVREGGILVRATGQAIWQGIFTETQCGHHRGCSGGMVTVPVFHAWHVAGWEHAFKSVGRMHAQASGGTMGFF